MSTKPRRNIGQTYPQLPDSGLTYPQCPRNLDECPRNLDLFLILRETSSKDERGGPSQEAKVRGFADIAAFSA
jgi:hypothetical protein